MLEMSMTSRTNFSGSALEAENRNRKVQLSNKHAKLAHGNIGTFFLFFGGVPFQGNLHLRFVSLGVPF